MGTYVTPGSVYCLLCGLEKLLYLSGSQGTHLIGGLDQAWGI